MKQGWYVALCGNAAVTDMIAEVVRVHILRCY